MSRSRVNSRESFTWLHLSDIHWTEPNNSAGGARQEYFLEHLLDDVRQQCQRNGTPDVVLVTGDVAWSGAEVEFRRAATWLGRLAQLTRIPSSLFFIVPGNHDVQRDVVQRRPLIRLIHQALQASPEELDNLLASSEDADLVLSPKFENFNNFALHFGQKPPAVGRRFYACQLETRLGSITVVGLNTAALSFRDEEHGKLVVSRLALSSLLRDAHAHRELTLVLLHHPLDWLHDGGSALLPFIDNCPSLLFFGHMHERDLSRVQRFAFRSDHLQIIAGPTYASDREATITWSMGRLSVEGLEIWPRRWVKRQARFGADDEFSELKGERLHLEPSRLPLLLRDWLVGAKSPRMQRAAATAASPEQDLAGNIQGGLRVRSLVRIGAPVVICARFVGTSGRVLAGGEDNVLSLIDFGDGGGVLQKFQGHTGTVASLAVSADGRYAASGGRDNCVRLWDLHERRLVWTHNHGSWVYAVAMTPDASQLIVGDNSGILTVYRRDNGRVLWSQTGHTDYIHEVCTCSSGRLAASSGRDRRAVIWDLMNRSERIVLPTFGSKVRSLAFSGKDEPSFLLLGDGIGSIHRWNIQQGCVEASAQLHRHTVNGLQPLHDGEVCISTSRDCSVCLFATDTLALIARVELPEEVNDVSVDVSGRYVAVGCDDGCVYLLEYESAHYCRKNSISGP